MDTITDIARAVKVLGWQPQWSLPREIEAQLRQSCLLLPTAWGALSLLRGHPILYC